MATKANKHNNNWPNVLRFIASLLFLYVIFGTATWSGWVSPGSVGALWLPILFGLAVLSSIGLFFGSLAGIAWPSMGGGMAWKAMMVASFSLFALTAGPSWSSSFWIVVLGFIVGWLGSAMEMM